MRATLLFMGILLFISFAKADGVDVQAIAAYLNSAHTVREFVILARSQDQRNYLISMINDGKVSEKITPPKIEADSKKKTISVSGDWGKVAADLSLVETKKQIIINGKVLPLKESYRIEDFADKKSAYFSPILSSAYAATPNTIENFFSSIVGSATHTWVNYWHDTSKDVLEFNMFRGFKCEGARLSEIAIGENKNTIKIGYASDGEVVRMDTKDLNGNQCILMFAKGQIVNDRIVSGNCDRYGHSFSVNNVLLNTDRYYWSGPSYFEKLNSCCKSDTCKQTMQTQIDKNNTAYEGVRKNTPPGPNPGSYKGTM